MVELVRAGAGLIAAAILCVGYGVVEARLHRLTRYRIPVLDPGSEPVRILQVSDLHLRVSSKRLAEFVRRLSDQTYDMVFATGDLLGEPAALSVCIEVLNGLSATYGRYFVFGSSDYYAPKFKNYFDYFLGRRQFGTQRNRTGELRSGLVQQGWKDLNNATLFVEVHGGRVQITGLDDPYLHRDDRSLLARDRACDLALCVMHDPAPYLDAARTGFDLMVAGHTHGGQVRLPFVGALVTNSDLPRRYARGLHRIDRAWLFVTPGLGTGKYAPFRFLCPPEASVLELTARS